MLFEYRRHRGAISPVTDAATFRVDALTGSRVQEAPAADLSHLLDLSYNYHSPRELRWHIAERLGILPTRVELREAA